MVKEITSFIQLVCSKLPNLEKFFPTEESRYNAFIKLLYIALCCPIVSKILQYLAKPKIHMVGYRQVVEEPSFLLSIGIILSSILLLIVSLVIIYAMIYVYIKSGFLEFALRLIIGFIVGLMVMGILTSILGSFAMLLSVIISIVANRRRIAILKKYMPFVWYGVGGILSPIFLAILGFILVLSGAHIGSNIAYIGIFLIILAFLSPTLIMHYALRKELSRGRAFLDTMRLIQIVPLVILCCFISFLTLTHLSGLSDNSIFGDPETDFLANGPIHSFTDASTVYAAPQDTLSTFTSTTPNHLTDMNISTASGDFMPSSNITTDNLIHTNSQQDFTNIQQLANNTTTPISSTMKAVDVPSDITIQNNMNQPVMTATTDTVTGNTTFHDNLGQTIASASNDQITGDTTFHNAMEQTTMTLTNDGTILNQLNLSDGHIVRLDNGDMAILDSQNHLIQTVTADGTIKDPLNQTIGHIKI